MGLACGIGHALQGPEPPVQEACGKRIRHSQINVCMHPGSSRIYKKAFGKNSAKRSGRSRCRKGIPFSKSVQSCGQVYLHASGNENTGCSGGQRMRIASMANDQSKEQKSGTSKRQKKSNDQLILLRKWTSIISKMRSWSPNFRNTMAGLYPKSMYRARFVCMTNDSRKSNGCHRKATRICRTSRRRSISLYPSQNEGRFNIIETFQIIITTQVAQILVQH